jgi:hypothetical protein
VTAAIVVLLLYAWLIARLGLQLGPVGAAAMALLGLTIAHINRGLVYWMVY